MKPKQMMTFFKPGTRTKTTIKIAVPRIELNLQL